MNESGAHSSNIADVTLRAHIIAAHKELLNRRSAEVVHTQRNECITSKVTIHGLSMLNVSRESCQRGLLKMLLRSHECLFVTL